MKPEDSLPHSRAPATCPHHKQLQKYALYLCGVETDGVRFESRCRWIWKQLKIFQSTQLIIAVMLLSLGNDVILICRPSALHATHRYCHCRFCDDGLLIRKILGRIFSLFFQVYLIWTKFSKLAVLTSLSVLIAFVQTCVYLVTDCIHNSTHKYFIHVLYQITLVKVTVSQPGYNGYLVAM